jgi:pimeloyl-ACP methyl ester carboxylesterase
MLVGLGGLLANYWGLDIEHTQVGSTPMTLFQDNKGPPGPVVVVAHGFAGSRQLMHPFAVSLARNGYRALVFDFPGHGRNAEPLAGQLGDADRAASLLSALSAVADYGRALPAVGEEARLALLGHSMAGDIAVRYAREHPDVAAIVAVSPYLSMQVAELPRVNLLFIYGAWEPAVIREQGREAVASVTDAPPQALDTSATYGHFDAGTARRLVIADGVEHIGVLYSATSLKAAVAWLDEVFEWDGRPVGIDHRGPWLGIYYLGVLLLAWPLALRLPQVTAQRLGAGSAPGWGWRKLLPVALVPPLVTPLLLWPVPTDFLAIVIGDYIALHFAVYGALTLVMLWRAGVRPLLSSTRMGALILAIVLVALFETLALSLPTHAFVASYLPAPHRLATVAALFAGTLIWFVADEWATRGINAPRPSYALTKFLFLLSLMLAVALNLRELFFLVIIIPAILVLFLVYGLFSSWIYRRTGQPLVAAITNAFAFASAIAVSFPLVG